MTNPEPATRPRGRMKWIALLAALLLLYAASPYYSIWRFGQALRAHDMDALAARVDFDAVRGLLVYERVILAQELRAQPLFPSVAARLEGVPLEEVSHESFKLRTVQALGIIRTGECTPYANIGLVAGVAF